jgi:hypothetical protein
MPSHHRQTPPEERGIKRMKGGFAVSFIFGGLDG